MYRMRWEVGLSSQITVELLGSILIDGEIMKDRPSIAYIHEFFGDSSPPEQFHSMIDCSLILPGYEGAVLSDECEGNCLTWERYGRAVAEAIQSIHLPFTLVGNSMGAMVAMYAAMNTSLIDKIILYRIPRFGEARLSLRRKYQEISHSITDENTYTKFLVSINEHTDPSVIRVLEKTKWNIAKKLYEGASLSDLDLTVLHQIKQSVILVEHDFKKDHLHPKEAYDLLQSLLVKF